MRFAVLPAAVGIVCALAAGTLQFAADGAFGSAAAPHSIPHAIAAHFGDGLARALGTEPRGVAPDALAIGAQVDTMDTRGDYRGARAMQQALVTRLEGDRNNREVLAGALWRLGQLDAEVGYREPAQRRREWPKALADYRAALELVPLSVTTLLAAGNQSLLNGRRSEAADYFRRALASDPSSDAARDGLHRALTGEDTPPPFVAPAEWHAR